MLPALDLPFLNPGQCTACGVLKLLFDENLSSRLVSSHVNLICLAGATDLEIWAYARA
jgi:hypothetical protein